MIILASGIIILIFVIGLIAILKKDASDGTAFAAKAIVYGLAFFIGVVALLNETVDGQLFTHTEPIYALIVLLLLGLESADNYRLLQIENAKEKLKKQKVEEELKQQNENI